jgi:hypothetical protein
LPRKAGTGQSMIPKSAKRFSGKIMLNEIGEDL